MVSSRTPAHLSRVMCCGAVMQDGFWGPGQNKKPWPGSLGPAWYWLAFMPSFRCIFRCQGTSVSEHDFLCGHCLCGQPVFICLHGLHADMPPLALGFKACSLAFGMEGLPKEAPHLLPPDRQFSPAEQCPAPWGLPVYPLAHHPSGLRGNTEFTQPGPSLFFHAHCLQHR